MLAVPVCWLMVCADAGNDPSMLLINTLFRVNGSAVILTNKPNLASKLT
jgi:hypothetical protein